MWGQADANLKTSVCSAVSFRGRQILLLSCCHLLAVASCLIHVHQSSINLLILLLSRKWISICAKMIYDRIFSESLPLLSSSTLTLRQTVKSLYKMLYLRCACIFSAITVLCAMTFYPTDLMETAIRDSYFFENKDKLITIFKLFCKVHETIIWKQV